MYLHDVTSTEKAMHDSSCCSANQPFTTLRHAVGGYAQKRFNPISLLTEIVSIVCIVEMVNVYYQRYPLSSTENTPTTSNSKRGLF